MGNHVVKRVLIFFVKRLLSKAFWSRSEFGLSIYEFRWTYRTNIISLRTWPNINESEMGFYLSDDGAFLSAFTSTLWKVAAKLRWFHMNNPLYLEWLRKFVSYFSDLGFFQTCLTKNIFNWTLVFVVVLLV